MWLGAQARPSRQPDAPGPVRRRRHLAAPPRLPSPRSRAVSAAEATLSFWPGPWSWNGRLCCLNRHPPSPVRHPWALELRSPEPGKGHSARACQAAAHPWGQPGIGLATEASPGRPPGPCLARLLCQAVSAQAEEGSEGGEPLPLPVVWPPSGQACSLPSGTLPACRPLLGHGHGHHETCAPTHLGPGPHSRSRGAPSPSRSPPSSAAGPGEGFRAGQPVPVTAADSSQGRRGTHVPHGLPSGPERRDGGRVWC